MQSELLSHISSLFTGKGLRRFEAVITTIDSPAGSGKKGLFSERWKERFLRSSDDTDDTGAKDNKQDAKGKTRGINFMNFANMDFKFNFKGTNSSDNPPPVPARHFSANNSDDLPPPLPERKCSLDSGIDEEFQGRFIFRPLSTAPLPEVYGNCNKSYPSKMHQAFQRPAHHPPPPPLPEDLFPSPTEEKTVSCTPRSFPQQLKPVNTSGLKSPANTSSLKSPASTSGLESPATPSFTGTTPQEDNFQQSVYNEVPDDDLDLPPPPARRLPPPPPSKMKTASTVSKVAVYSAPISTAGIIKSPKLKALSPLKLPAIPPADSQMTHSLDSLPATPPFTPPPPPPPPPPPTTACVSQPMNKHTPINGLPKQNVLNAYSVTLPEPLHVVKEMKNYKELPQLPDKPSENCTVLSESSPGVRKHPPKPPVPNGISKNKTKIILSRNQKPPLPQRSASPLPSTQSSKLSVSVSPMPEFSSRTNHPNKSRPLPNIPSVITGKNGTPPKVTGGWGGVEVFDPREEDGDIYDVMDSTDM